MFDVLKAAALLQKIVTPDHASWLTASEVLWAATRGGARSVALADEIGAIEPGRKADLVLLDLHTINFTPLNDVRNHLVYCENGTSIVQVMVNGAVVVQDGRCLLVDEDAVLAEIRALAPEMLARHAQVERANEVFAPYFTEIHRRCCAQRLPINRYAGDESAWLRR